MPAHNNQIKKEALGAPITHSVINYSSPETLFVLRCNTYEYRGRSDEYYKYPANR